MRLCFYQQFFQIRFMKNAVKLEIYYFPSELVGPSEVVGTTATIIGLCCHSFLRGVDTGVFTYSLLKDQLPAIK